MKKITLAPNDVISATASAYQLDPSDLTGRSRVRHIVRARHVAMAALRQETPMSLPAIGRAFDRDHTTVLHALSQLGIRYTQVEVDVVVDAAKEA